MIHFALPDAPYRYDLNNFMFSLVKAHPEFFKTNISFYASKCSIPYLTWGGGVATNVGPGMYYDDLQAFQKVSALPMHVNLSNVLLEDYDYDDCLGQQVLSSFNNGSNVLEISSIPFMEKIVRDYPYYRFIFSAQADLITNFTPELLNTISSEGKFLYISLPTRVNKDIEFLSQLKSKHLYEITVNPKCLCECADVCTLKLHQNQLDFVRQSHVDTCSKTCLKPMISIEDIQNTYSKMGFTHFTFVSDITMTIDEALYQYLDYFIIDEYRAITEHFWRQGRVD